MPGEGAGIVGFRSAEDLALHYFREALLLARLLPERGPFLDIGSGGGTPALPLAIAGGGHWILLEPRQVSAAFLEMAADKLGLSTRVRVVRQRLKEFLRSEAGRTELAPRFGRDNARGQAAFRRMDRARGRNVRGGAGDLADLPSRPGARAA